MELAIYLFMLIFHIVFCKVKLKSLTLPFSIYGIIWFVVLIAIRLPIINFPDFHSETIGLIILAYLCFLLPHVFMKQGSLKKMLDDITTKVNIKKVRKVFFVVLAIYFVFFLLNAYTLISHYGSVMYILRNAYTVRHDTIGSELVPIYITYGLSIGYVAAGLGSYLLFFTKSNLFQKLMYVMPFIFAFASDMLISARMGMLFFIIIYVSALLLKFNHLSKKERRHNVRVIVLILAVALIALFVPKYLRDASVGGGDYSEYLEYVSNESILKLPLIGQFMHYFIYITGPVAAFDNFIANFSSPLTMGEAQFLPLVHILDRLFGIGSEYNLIYDFVEVPFPTNIFSYLREAYSDFGILGVMLTPLFLGFLTALASSYKFKNRLMGLAIFQYLYLYSIFSIFYTPYSQGGPVIGFGLYIVILLFVNFGKGEKHGQLRTSHVQHLPTNDQRCEVDCR